MLGKSKANCFPSYLPVGSYSELCTKLTNCKCNVKFLWRVGYENDFCTKVFLESHFPTKSRFKYILFDFIVQWPALLHKFCGDIFVGTGYSIYFPLNFSEAVLALVLNCTVNKCLYNMLFLRLLIK